MVQALSTAAHRERRALLDHAALCEISHTHATKTLRMMAQEYEKRPLDSKVSREMQRMTSAQVWKCSKLNKRTRSE